MSRKTSITALVRKKTYKMFSTFTHSINPTIVTFWINPLKLSRSIEEAPNQTSIQKSHYKKYQQSNRNH